MDIITIATFSFEPGVSIPPGSRITVEAFEAQRFVELGIARLAEAVELTDADEAKASKKPKATPTASAE